MWTYYLGLSLRSLRRTPSLYALVIITLAIGVGALCSNLALFQAMSADPIPGKSDKLFHVSLNTWPEDDTPHEQPHFASRYLDAQKVLESDIPTYATAHYQTRVYTKRMNAKTLQRYSSRVRATTPSFFALTDAPFMWGRGFMSAEGTEVVIGHELNTKLFGGKNSVGEHIEIDGKPYSVVGVLKPWHLRPRFYHMEQNSAFHPTSDLFVPLETAIDSNWGVWGHSSSVNAPGELSESRPLNKYYLSLWVELNSEAQKKAFAQYLDDYTQSLKDNGNHPLAINNQLHDIKSWAKKQKVVDERLLAFSIATALFLLVCIFNASSLLLAKFHSEKSEMGLRRALGASRSNLFRQGVIEASIVGVIGGIAALFLSWLFLQISVQLIPDLKPVAHLDFAVLTQGFCIAIATAWLSTAYPLWQANRASISAEMK